MTLLVTGAGGQLGQDLVDALVAGPGSVPGGDVVGLRRTELDVGDRAALDDCIGSLRPSVVFNCASWTDVDGCERDPARAELVNATAVGWLAAACARVGAVLVQVSSDYVYSGASAPVDADGQPRGWREDDPLAPVNVYGRAKAAAEALVRERLERHHIVRTAWLSGARGRNFTTSMLVLGRERDHLDVVDDQVSNPTSTRDLATAIVQLLVTEAYGTVHLTNTGWCSRFEQAAAIMELAGLDVEVRPVASSAFPTAAARPGWSALDGGRAAGLGIELPGWRDGLARVLQELGHLPVRG